MSEEHPPERRCYGGPKPRKWCGKVATVVCSDGATPPLEWFACDDPTHQQNATTEPIADWFERVLNR
jgi:hypothetical protein